MDEWTAPEARHVEGIRAGTTTRYPMSRDVVDVGITRPTVRNEAADDDRGEDRTAFHVEADAATGKAGSDATPGRLKATLRRQLDHYRHVMGVAIAGRDAIREEMLADRPVYDEDLEAALFCDFEACADMFDWASTNADRVAAQLKDFEKETPVHPGPTGTP